MAADRRPRYCFGSPVSKGGECHGWGAFDESRRLLTNPRVRNDRLALFEMQLRRVFGQLENLDKPLMLSEIGFPSATGHTREAENLIIPIRENEKYDAAMRRFIGIIRGINHEYQGRIQAIYFYEWRDNLYHSRIWNVEESPIHTAFDLCDRFGNPKFDIKRLVANIE